MAATVRPVLKRYLEHRTEGLWIVDEYGAVWLAGRIIRTRKGVDMQETTTKEAIRAGLCLNRWRRLNALEAVQP